MKKRTRTILFFSLFFAFALFAPAVVLYSQGYRFDFEKRKITQTGAIFLQTEPKQTEIYIDDELAQKTDFFFGSGLLKNLLPKEYKITLKKDGYYLWEKNLEIREKQVTEAKNIILIPTKINFATSTENIAWPPEVQENVLIVLGDYTFSKEGKVLYFFNNDSQTFEKIFDGVKNLKASPDNKKLVFFSASEIWIFYLKDKLEMPFKKAGEKQFLIRLSEKINDVFWLNNDYLIFNAGDKIKIAETDDRDRIQTWDTGNFPNPQILFNNTDKKLYILSEKNLFVSENLLK